MKNCITIWHGTQINTQVYKLHCSTRQNLYKKHTNWEIERMREWERERERERERETVASWYFTEYRIFQVNVIHMDIDILTASCLHWNVTTKRISLMWIHITENTHAHSSVNVSNITLSRLMDFLSVKTGSIFKPPLNRQGLTCLCRKQ